VTVRTFLIELRTNEEGAYRRLRNTLKTAWRRDRLKCVSAVEKTETAAGAAIPAIQKQDVNHEQYRE
jgi:hypothetical protein